MIMAALSNRWSPHRPGSQADRPRACRFFLSPRTDSAPESV